MKPAILKRLGAFSLGLALIASTGCFKSAQQKSDEAAEAALANPTAFRLYVSNEVSGDLTIIDSATYKVIATVPLGKRPRGIHASPDRKTIFIAVSGSPVAGPGVDESTLPPPDRSADGIAVFDVKQNKVVRIIHAGVDPEIMGGRPCVSSTRVPVGLFGSQITIILVLGVIARRIAARSFSCSDRFRQRPR